MDIREERGKRVINRGERKTESEQADEREKKESAVGNEYWEENQS